MAENKNATKKPNAVLKFLKETIVELKKVVWPTKKQLFVNTTIVVIASIIMSLFIAGADFGLVKLVNRLLFLK